MELWFINRVCSLLKKEDSDEVMSLFVARTLAVHFSPFDAQYLPHHRNSPASLGDEDRWRSLAVRQLVQSWQLPLLSFTTTWTVPPAPLNYLNPLLG